ncbi:MULTISPECIES: hypothetical protein [Lactiplantibacillus]|uniref:hypothetical protein n=1 Tax=Lactiplantibacillus TaxID=2767842 RepID=UPI000A4B1857|nr:MULTISPECIES: hypothetical protein [Lactiplantibacillus]MBO2714386.1 hypothetical protein [Lactiplantibacillus plantarum]MBO2724200.1 hypothetical protein [Lactiplantibacillus plantarum]MCJ2383048.1 hypothetical protein [Lactiplantibacillus plantarum]MCK8474649.1 hypothetical protein [Lactiplantibacillus plantarum]MCM8651897.1 hypothetical protein [Lactiplantibacillus sp. C232]
MSTRNKIGFGIIICLSIVLGVTALVNIFIEGGIIVGTICTIGAILISLALILIHPED